MFDDYIVRWHLKPDGDPISTQTSQLLPVRWRGQPAMLKVALQAEERTGAALMSWWDGDGAARVLAHRGDAISLERAEGGRSLESLALSGGDEEANLILCSVVKRLHGLRARALPELIPLDVWFSELGPIAAAHGGILARCHETARRLLATPHDAVVLHGDIHHNNILDFGDKGWLERQLDVVANAARVEPRRLLEWVLASMGLSAAWHLNDGRPIETELEVAQIASSELG